MHRFALWRSRHLTVHLTKAARAQVDSRNSVIGYRLSVLVAVTVFYRFEFGFGICRLSSVLTMLGSYINIYNVMFIVGVYIVNRYR